MYYIVPWIRLGETHEMSEKKKKKKKKKMPPPPPPMPMWRGGRIR